MSPDHTSYRFDAGKSDRTPGQTVLVTGGCGLIGSNFIRLLTADPDVSIVNLDRRTYAGNLANLVDLAGHLRYRFLKGDLTDPRAVRSAFETGVRHVIHFAAESHVDRSIQDSGPFVRTNVVGARANAAWVAQIRSGAYLEYYERQYGVRAAA